MPATADDERGRRPSRERLGRHDGRPALARRVAERDERVRDPAGKPAERRKQQQLDQELAAHMGGRAERASPRTLASRYPGAKPVLPLTLGRDRTAGGDRPLPAQLGGRRRRSVSTEKAG